MKLETSRNVTKSKRSAHWCRSISKKYLCRFYYSISQKVITLSGRRFITVSGGFITLSGGFITLSGSYYIIGRFLLHYRARITLSGVYYIIGWYNTVAMMPVSSTLNKDTIVSHPVVPTVAGSAVGVQNTLGHSCKTESPAITFWTTYFFPTLTIVEVLSHPDNAWMNKDQNNRRHQVKRVQDKRHHQKKQVRAAMLYTFGLPLSDRK